MDGKGTWEKTVKEINVQKRHTYFISANYARLLYFSVHGTYLLISGLKFYRFSVSLLYYGIMFHIPDLSGERHLNFFLGAVVEGIAYVLAYIILSRFGRRLPMASFLLISSIICIAVGAVTAVPGKGAYWIGKYIFL